MNATGHGRMWFCLLVLLGPIWMASPFEARAAKASVKKESFTATPAQTVEEIVLLCTRAIAAGDWESAAMHSDALLNDYGDRTDLAPLCQRLQRVLLFCRLRLHQWEEAVPLFEPILRNLKRAPEEVRGEWLLQKANCEAHLKHFPAARTTITTALSLLPQTGPRKHEATLLLAACTLHCNEPLAAGKLLEQALASLPIPLTERAVMLGMRAYLEAKTPAAALTLFLKGRTASPRSSTRIAIQLLLLETVSSLLEIGDPLKALHVAANLEPPERLTPIQVQRIAQIQRAIGDAQHPQGPTDEAITILQNEAAQMQAEIESVGNGAPLAEATVLLSASAYRALHRPHEAALVLDHATARLAPSAQLETASLELIKEWFELGRSQRVIEAAERFSKTYPNSRLLPVVRYFRGCAEQKAGFLENARETFQTLSKDPKAGEFAVNARYMHALTLLLEHKLPEAVQALALFLRNHKTHFFAETAAYGLCIAKAQTGPSQDLRAAAHAYLDLFPNGENRPAVLLKRAQAFTALKQISAASIDLETLLAETPEHACSGEAALLLGDCRLALGDVAGALAAWRGIPADQAAARDEGLLKCARQLFRCEKFMEARDLLRTVASPGTDSSRVAETAAWLWKACDRLGNPEEAAAWTLERIEAIGNDPSSTGIEPLLLFAAVRANSTPGENAWTKNLTTLSATTSCDGRTTLHSRLQWARAKARRGCGDTETTQDLIRAATLYPAPVTGPAVLADGADAAQSDGCPADAERLWRDLLKWHPGAPQRDRAFIALAKIECDAKHTDAACGWVERFEKATPTSPLRPQLLLVKAALQNLSGSVAEALGTLDQLLKEKGATAAVKAEALFQMGAIHFAAGATRVAIAYLQRTYVSYARFEPWSSKAYVLSAEAFQALGDRASARNTYREFLASEAPADTPERLLAAERLNQLETTP